MKADETQVKTPFEVRLYNFDFSAELDEGETIAASPVPTITATPAGLTVAGLIVNVEGTIVQARFSGGVAGVEYHVTCQVSTTTQKRELCGDLLVLECI